MLQTIKFVHMFDRVRVNFRYIKGEWTLGEWTSFHSFVVVTSGVTHRTTLHNHASLITCKFFKAGHIVASQLFLC